MPEIEMKNFFKNNEQIFRNKFHLYFLSFRSFIFMGVKKEVKNERKEAEKKRFLSFAIVQFLITFITGLCKYNNQSTT